MMMFVPFLGEINDQINSKMKKNTLGWSGTIIRDVCYIKVWLWVVSAVCLTVVYQIFSFLSSSFISYLVQQFVQQHTLLPSVLNQAH